MGDVARRLRTGFKTLGFSSWAFSCTPVCTGRGVADRANRRCGRRVLRRFSCLLASIRCAGRPAAPS